MEEMTRMDSSVVGWRPLFRIPRLYRSTYVVGTLIAVLLLLANIPARIVRPTENGDVYYRVSDNGCYADHGWPWAFLRRNLDDLDRDAADLLVFESSVADVANVRAAAFWAMWRDVKAFSVIAFAADIATAIVLVTAGAAAFEAWRRRRRRLIQFYLGELLAFMTLAAVLLSWLSVETREYHEEQGAVRQIRAIYYKHSLTGPHWLRRLVGSTPFRFFDRVDDIYIRTRYSESRWLNEMRDIGPLGNAEQLSHLRHLRVLDCGHEPPNTILRLVPRPDRLVELTCVPAKEGLSCLQRAPNLQMLTLLAHFGSNMPRHCDIAPLASLNHLRLLDLGGHVMHTFGFTHVAVDDEGLSHLANLRRLEALAVTSSAVTDAGVSHLSELRRMRLLDLHHTGLTNAGLQHLAKMDYLEELDIRWTNITDAGLESLKHWRRLKRLDVSDERVTSAGIRKLKEALLDCVIRVWNHSADEVGVY